MSQIRYFVLPLQQRWTIRRDCRRIGAFLQEQDAINAALELAAIDRVRGHVVAVLKQSSDGRWTPCGRRPAAGEPWILRLSPARPVPAQG